ncbi:hypothetical protein [Breoghania sp. JC706]|uniref:hypothetical protein n=1 Tax=Breoghania sp. JC706 TaxID=3117732 RepID=UPI00300A7A6B
MKDAWKYFAACLLGFAIAGWAGQIAAVGVVGFLAKWQTLIAGILAFCGAAWTVYWIKRQVDEAGRIARAVADETKTIFDAELGEILKLINVTWELLEISTNQNESLDRRNKAHGRSIGKLHELRRRISISDLRLETAEMSPVARAGARSVLAALERTKAEIGGMLAARFTDEQQRTDRQTMMLIEFSHIAEYVERYDPALSRIFDKRERLPVDHRSMSELSADALRRGL